MNFQVILSPGWSFWALKVTKFLRFETCDLYTKSYLGLSVRQVGTLEVGYLILFRCLVA